MPNKKRATEPSLRSVVDELRKQRAVLEELRSQKRAIIEALGAMGRAVEERIELAIGSRPAGR